MDPKPKEASVDVKRVVIPDLLFVVCSPGRGGGEGVCSDTPATSSGERRGGDCVSWDMVDDGSLKIIVDRKLYQSTPWSLEATEGAAE